MPHHSMEVGLRYNTLKFLRSNFGSVLNGVTWVSVITPSCWQSFPNCGKVQCNETARAQKPACVAEK